MSTGLTFDMVERDCKPVKYIPLFVDSWNRDPDNCLKIIMNIRDIKNGKGHRQICYIILLCLKICKPLVYKVILRQIVESVGCWKDLLYMCEHTIDYNIKTNGFHTNDYELELFTNQLKFDQQQLANNPNHQISLAAKWAPSEKTHFNNNKLRLANKLANMMMLTPKDYRKLIVHLRSKITVVESYMSQDRWELIKFEDIPSKAHKNYKKAFLRDTNSKGVKSEQRTDTKNRYQEYTISNNNYTNYNIQNIKVNQNDYININDININALI
jgi:hypothetical protein